MKPTCISDLETALGTKVARALIAWAKERGGLRRLPSSVQVMRTKREYYLNDGDGLFALGVNLETGEITGSQYGGSGETACNYARIQHSTGSLPAPVNHAVAFVRCYWNGRNQSWSVDFVTDQLAPSLPERCEGLAKHLNGMFR